MRPDRLEMEGFAPFRGRTVVDLSGLELFVLTGPTGAGKSSVIDALTFALYGSVPRYGKRSVASIVSLGKSEARVRFDFEVEGVGYTVARQVKRKDRGGVGSEARLERGDEVLASGGEVTVAVESLLGLSVDHFTRSVVLPQGQFAAFLHDTPAGQQDLVKALLDMGVLDTVRRLATERAKTARAVADQAEVRLDQLHDATDEAEGAAGDRLRQLEQLVDPVRAAEEAIIAGEAAVRQRRAETDQLDAHRQVLASVSVPEGAAELAEQLKALDTRIQEAAEACQAAEEAREKLAEEARQAPALATLDAALDLEKRLAEAVARRDGVDLEALEREVSRAAERFEQAEADRRRAGEELEAERDRHAAHALAAGLSAGDPCPVCRRPLDDDPPPPPADLEDRRRRYEQAEKAAGEAGRRHREAESELTMAQAVRQAASDQVTELEERRPRLPHGPDLAERRERRLELDRRLEKAELGLREAREKRGTLEEQRLALEGSARQAWESFAAARDRLASLGPPPAGRDDLARAWQELSEWARVRSADLEEQLVQARAAAEDAGAAVDKQRDELERTLVEAGVEGTGGFSARLAGAVATARAELQRVRERVRERKSLEEDRRRFEARAQVATSLGQHLRADRFEGWLLAEALGSLVDGANGLLSDLTAGAYSLALDDRIIEVVDHRNADEHRSVRSLSGGETFLVSLALALSLGEQLTNLSDRGGARLEAIFLDEGFGSLDAETLETVTVVVSELAARGRTVGLVTHVKELAEQIPVRFEVSTGPAGSTVARL